MAPDNYFLPAGCKRRTLLTQSLGGQGSGEHLERAVSWEPCSLFLGKLLSLLGLWSLK